MELDLYPIDYRLAAMYIDFNDENTQYLWQLDYNEFNEAKSNVMPNALEMECLIKAFGKRIYIFLFS